MRAAVLLALFACGGPPCPQVSAVNEQSLDGSEVSYFMLECGTRAVRSLEAPSCEEAERLCGGAAGAP